MEHMFNFALSYRKFLPVNKNERGRNCLKSLSNFPFQKGKITVIKEILPSYLGPRRMVLA